MLNLRPLIDRLVEDVLTAIRNATLEELVETRGEPFSAKSEPRGRKSRGGRPPANDAPGAEALAPGRAPARGLRDERPEKKERAARARGRRSAVDHIEAAAVEAPAVGDITDPAALLASVARERHAETEGPRSGRVRSMPALLRERERERDDAAAPAAAKPSDEKTEVPASGGVATSHAPAASPADVLRDRDPIRRGVVIRRARPA
jgi:hypothetical protein